MAGSTGLFVTLLPKKIRDARNEFYKNNLNCNSGDPEGIWNTLNYILKRNKNNENNETFIIDGVETVDEHKIASEFNTFLGEPKLFRRACF